MRRSPAPARPVPLRGTQSLVGVMSFVWRHPSLTLIEVLWRWAVALPMLWLAWHKLAPAWLSVALDRHALDSMTFLEPVRSVRILLAQTAPFVPALRQLVRWWLPLALVLWAAAGGVGRSAVLRRADKHLLDAVETMAVVSLGRAVAYVALLAGWLFCLGKAVRGLVIAPTLAGGEPNLVLLTAAGVLLTLAAFALWSLSIWALDLVPVRRVATLRPRDLAERMELRSKLVETNLVMGIVRVALLVLAMTFSASPLPFQTQQTQGFIEVWWIGVGLAYVLASDYFHVVRRVTYLRLLQSIATRTNAPSERAS